MSPTPPLVYEVRTVKGIEYAFFVAESGAYVVRYAGARRSDRPREIDVHAMLTKFLRSGET